MFKNKKALELGMGVIIAFVILVVLAILLFLFYGDIAEYMRAGGEKAISVLSFGGP